MLWTRIASGVILGPLFLALVYFGSPYFDVLVALIAGVMAWEFTRMDGKAGEKRRALITGAAVAAVIVMTFSGAALALALIVAATVALAVSDQAAGRRGLNILQGAVIYVAVPAVSLLYVLSVGGYISVFWVLAVVWFTDIGAYACGRIIGGPKLAPSISPNKTWAGAVGGLVIGVGVGLGLLSAFSEAVSVVVILVSALLSLATEAGDLFESKLKRHYNVKDSGGIIPGHGGVMDRFDGLWAATPIAALLCFILDGGVQQW